MRLEEVIQKDGQRRLQGGPSNIWNLNDVMFHSNLSNETILLKKYT